MPLDPRSALHFWARGRHLQSDPRALPNATADGHASHSVTRGSALLSSERKGRVGPVRSSLMRQTISHAESRSP
eukprot:459807-Prymnesium_polylepis.1